jgi:leader peptidase (prepilin peptidase)/N-methyltransferase
VLARFIGEAADPVRAGLGLLLYGGILFVVAAVSGGMGFGDVKLAALVGLVLGSLGLRFVGVASGAAIALGGIGGLVALGMGRGRKSAIPFGPYLAAGAVIASLWGEEISSWYIGRFL